MDKEGAPQLAGRSVLACEVAGNQITGLQVAGFRSFDTRSMDERSLIVSSPGHWLLAR
ncbi:UNVERIFIED_CONTAM: hypothetical protein Sradi_3606300 [Sesamum radiatum]|uniref:Uncharacterized protein n=1 Tax=Sesamum radiatum TaxID=300843 RepID=A0AAW2QH44_SESRA